MGESIAEVLADDSDANLAAHICRAMGMTFEECLRICAAFLNMKPGLPFEATPEETEAAQRAGGNAQVSRSRKSLKLQYVWAICDIKWFAFGEGIQYN